MSPRRATLRYFSKLVHGLCEDALKLVQGEGRKLTGLCHNVSLESLHHHQAGHVSQAQPHLQQKKILKKNTKEKEKRGKRRGGGGGGSLRATEPLFVTFFVPNFKLWDKKK